jgi:hypothetical protein
MPIDNQSRLPMSELVFVRCPECDSDKAVVSATVNGQMICFCPACEYAWDRRAKPRTRLALPSR